MTNVNPKLVHNVDLTHVTNFEITNWITCTDEETGKSVSKADFGKNREISISPCSDPLSVILSVSRKGKSLNFAIIDSVKCANLIQVLNALKFNMIYKEIEATFLVTKA